MYTEYAGVDWGYIGPGQGDKNNLEVIFPWWTFLGYIVF